MYLGQLEPQGQALLQVAIVYHILGLIPQVRHQFLSLVFDFRLFSFPSISGTMQLFVPFPDFYF